MSKLVVKKPFFKMYMTLTTVHQQNFKGKTVRRS